MDGQREVQATGGRGEAGQGDAGRGDGGRGDGGRARLRRSSEAAEVGRDDRGLVRQQTSGEATDVGQGDGRRRARRQEVQATAFPSASPSNLHREHATINWR